MHVQTLTSEPIFQLVVIDRRSANNPAELAVLRLAMAQSEGCKVSTQPNLSFLKYTRKTIVHEFLSETGVT